MKNKIVILIAVVAMFAAAACGKKPAETTEAVKTDSTAVKSDSTAATTPKDSTATTK